MKKKYFKSFLFRAGTLVFSTIISLNLSAQKQATPDKSNSLAPAVLTVIKNPVSDALDLKYNSESNQEIQLQLVDNTGKLVLSRQLNVLKGENRIKVEEVGRLASGLYILSVMDKKLNKYHAKIFKD